jgi:hypothetical protein
MQPPTPQQRRTWRGWIVTLGSLLIGLLLVRFLFRLLAARPDNLVVEWIMTVTNPLVQPFMFLDAQQPRFGAILELSTLTLIGVLACILLIGAWQARRQRGR